MRTTTVGVGTGVRLGMPTSMSEMDAEVERVRMKAAAYALGPSTLDYLASSLALIGRGWIIDDDTFELTLAEVQAADEMGIRKEILFSRNPVPLGIDS